MDIVRRAYEAWNRGDLETAFEFLDPEAEVSLPSDFPEAGTYRGRAEIRHWVAEQLLPTLEEVRAEPERFLDAGDQVRHRKSPRSRRAAVAMSHQNVEPLLGSAVGYMSRRETR